MNKLDKFGQDAIIFDDPLDVMIEQAALAGAWRTQIRDAVSDILAQFPGQPVTAAASAFIAKIGCNIGDHAVRADIKNAAIVEFARRGVCLERTI